MFCQKCGKPSESVICPECAAAEAAVEETVAESVQPAEVAVEAPAEAPVEEVATAVEEPAIELGEVTPEEAPKKKSKKGLWISLIALVAAVAVAAVAFWPTIKGWFSSPEEQFRDMTRASLTTYTEALSNAYGTLLKGDLALGSDYNNLKENLSLQLDSSLATSLAAVLNEQGINLDANELTNLSLSLETIEENDLLYVGLKAGLSTKELLTVKAFADMQNSIAYLGVPSLSEQYLKLDLKTMFGIDLANLDLMDLFAYNEDVSFGGDLYDYDEGLVSPTASASVLSSFIELLDNEHYINLQNDLPSEQEFNELLNRYIDVALEQITKVEETTETVTVNGHSQSLTVLSVKLDETLLTNIVKAVLNETKNDATIKKILTAVETYVTAMYGESVNLYDEMVAGIDELIAEIDAEVAEGTSGNYLLVKSYADGDESMGCDFTVATEGEENVSLGYNVVNEGGTYYFQMTANGQAAFTGYYTEEGDVTKGALEAPIAISFECSPTKDTLRVSLAQFSGLISELGIPAGILDSLDLEISLAQPSDAEASLGLAVLSGDTTMAALNLGVTGDNTTITLPQNTVDPTDQSQLGQWAMEAINNLPDLLENLGVSEDMVNELLSELMGSMMGL